MNKTNTRPGTRPAAEIRALASLETDSEIIERLAQLAGRYGTVLGIYRLPAFTHSDKDRDVFLIDFETTVGALTASLELKCRLSSFRTLTVSLPGSRRETRRTLVNSIAIRNSVQQATSAG
jgi:hypothetical protein